MIHFALCYVNHDWTGLHFLSCPSGVWRGWLYDHLLLSELENIPDDGLMASSAITRMFEILGSRPTASSETPPEVRSLGQKVGGSPGLIWLRISWFVTLVDLFLCSLTI